MFSQSVLVEEAYEGARILIVVSKLAGSAAALPEPESEPAHPAKASAAIAATALIFTMPFTSFPFHCCKLSAHGGNRGSFSALSQAKRWTSLNTYNKEYDFF